MSFKFLLTVSASLLLTLESHAENLYETPHDALVEAIHKGHATGVMGGEIAKQFEQQFHSKSPLRFVAKRLTSYKQSGCARISVDYTQSDVVTPNGKTNVTLNTQINYCLDGRAPTSLEQAQ